MGEYKITAQEKRHYRATIKRDNHSCVICGSRNIHVHHIVYRSHGGITDKRNMVCLCTQHHTMVHEDEPKWRDYLLDKMRSYYGMINEEDLKKHGNWAMLEYGN